MAPRIAHRPTLIATLAAIITIIAAFLMVTETRFTGDITENLRNDSDTYQSFRALEENFHAFSGDENILIRTEDLSDPKVYESFQNFLLDLQFAPQVTAAVSIFSLPSAPDPDVGQATADTGSGSPAGFFLTSPKAQALPIRERLLQLRSSIPLAGRMLSEDLKATIVVLMLTPAEEGEPRGLSPQNVEEIQKLAAAYSDAFSISFAGIPEIQRTIRSTLYSDQTKITIASTILCILVAWTIFRSWRGAIICSLPPIIGAVWYFGVLAIFRIPVDFLTTIIPTMVIVVSFADGVHLYMSIQRKRSEGEDITPAISHAIATTGPACFLASLTTALAFVGIGLGGVQTMHRLAITGSFGIMLAFLSVILLLPTLAHFLLDRRPSAKAHIPAFLKASARPAIWLATSFRRPTLLFALVLSVFLITIHIILPASFRVTDYLAEDTSIRQDEIYIEEKLGGSGQLYAIIPDPDGKKGLSTTDRTEIAAILASLNKKMTKPLDPEPVVGWMRQLDHLPSADENPMISRFVSKDGKSYLIPIPLGTMLAGEQISGYAEGLLTQLKQDGLEGKATLAGLSLLTGREAPQLIRDLRKGLMSAIAIVILSIMIIVRSVRVGIAFMLPNLIPIMTVEAYFWIVDRPLSMTAVIALTIAFGIAVDNSIHLLNQFRHTSKAEPGQTMELSMSHAISAITPAVVATTLLLVAGLCMTQLSSMPSVSLFGRLVMTALFVALLADLFLLPSFLLALERKPK
ncbi:MMPL family transporter [uncultured Cohaesibacter sp.]|uniref:efflux RND transporter permease subunit n=1 Tax=uncultured Cohaesibacter sp. TaxID=1002546 RepID=UPI0029C76EEE|nr:MMPL family transporter [uncultured Cohaesibacter sp.]